MEIQRVETQEATDKNFFKAVFHICVDGENTELWFETDQRYKDGFCQDRIDGIVAMMLLRCMAKGEDIFSTIPISAKLHHQLTSQLIPILSTYSKGQLKEIKINAPLTTQIYDGERIAGTGMSGGVDSLYTVMKYSEEAVDDQFRVKCLLVAQTDSIATKHEYSERYITNCNRAMEFAKEYGYSCLCVNTNFRDFYGSDRIQYTSEDTFMMCGIALLFSKMFNTYYFSGAQSIDYLTIEPPKASEAYNLVTLPLLSTENLTFYLGGFCGRFQKERELSLYEPSYKYLNVCWHYSATERMNCGECGKCRRTILAFDIIGCMDKYRSVFNLENYNENRNSILADIVVREDDKYGFLQELFDAAIRNDFKFPEKSLKIAKARTKQLKREKTKQKLKGMLRKIKRLFVKSK
ncbi:MAG: hypothetical protein E7680_01385 [Ruminococcaceae bacterium]|nr:hypothetical protein [Oscillospiraceae bacterium]